MSVLAILLVAPAGAAAFSVESFTVMARNADGTVDELAGTHPFSLEVHAAVDTTNSGGPAEPLRQVEVSLPPGLVGNSLDTPRCSADSPASCSGSNQVGILQFTAVGLGQVTVPVYNLSPAFGYAGAFGVTIGSESLVQQLRLSGVGGAGSIRLSSLISPSLGITEVDEQIWGVPADPAHDAERVCRSATGDIIEGCSSGAELLPLLTLPGSCSGPLVNKLTATSFGLSPVTAVAFALSRDASGNPRPLNGCAGVPFQPRLSVQSEGAALASSAFKVGLEVPQYEGADVTAAASVQRLEIKLPDGFALNPSAGSWLSGCPLAAVGLESAPGTEPPDFDEEPAECPPSSGLGTVKLRTPLIDHELEGAIYLATPFANPMDSRYAIYLVIEDEATGTVLKVPARIDADAGNGRLTATIPELPQFPFEDLELEFSGGTRALLVSPTECGRYTTEADFTPSTAPFAPVAARSVGVTVDRGAGGAPCPQPEAGRSARPSLQAGTTGSVAGTESSLVIELSREDSDQHLGAFALTFPPGLIADLGSTPVGAEVGGVRVEAGVGPQPLALDGKAYLGGPYRGAPYSLTMVVPGHAGPFDLGTIVERVAVDFDPATAQVSVRADQLPQILEGVPLQLRAIRLDLDRAGFIRNPTSCEPMTIAGTATTSLGQTAPISSRFQVGECAQLAFSPKLSVRFSGALGANGHPTLRATLRTEPSGAALRSAAFTLPEYELLDLHHLRALCPQAAGVGQCPASSRLGTLSLQSPDLEAPLEGPVYLRVPSRRLPDLSAELSFGGSSFMLPGRTTTSHGTLGVSLESLPDIPLSTAVLTLSGGRRGILVNSRSLCGKRGPVGATFSAHNGMQRKLRVPVQVKGCR
jgi:hypothetical protein